METQGLRLAGSSRALMGTRCQVILSCLGVSLGILAIDSLPVNGCLWEQGTSGLTHPRQCPQGLSTEPFPELCTAGNRPPTLSPLGCA